MYNNIKSLLKFFVEEIRDESIEQADRKLKFINLNSPTTKRWYEAYQTGDISKLTDVMIPDIVDSVIFKLMSSLDNEDIELYMKNKEGKFVSLSEIGESELAGFYIVDAIEEFSKQRKNPI